VPARVNLNGAILEPENARVSIFDHGFLYGDAVYETLRTYGGRPFLLPEHFQRLGEATEELGIPMPWTAQTVAAAIEETLDAAQPEPEWLIRIILTRGVGPLSPDPAGCPEPTRIIIVNPHHDYPPELYRNGVGIAVSRRHRDPAIASIKTGNLIHQVLGARDAADAEVSEVVFLNPKGYLSDGTRSNLFLVADGCVLTPSEGCGIVRGITRTMVLDVARAIGLEVVEGLLERNVLAEASEAFLTSTTRGIMAATRADGRLVGDGRVGPITKRLDDAYRKEVERRITESP
jgi:branched-chain amino acid aminotransferase